MLPIIINTKNFLKTLLFKKLIHKKINPCVLASQGLRRYLNEKARAGW
jgi:hypothetical protein